MAWIKEKEFTLPTLNFEKDAFLLGEKSAFGFPRKIQVQ